MRVNEKFELNQPPFSGNIQMSDTEIIPTNNKNQGVELFTTKFKQLFRKAAFVAVVLCPKFSNGVTLIPTSVFEIYNHLK